MSGANVGPNQNPVLYARNSAGGIATYVTATNNKLDVNATASLAGVAIPIVGATTAVGVAIVDSSGNQISSFGGGTQYVDAAVVPAHATAPTLVWSDGSVWQTVSTAKPLPMTVVGTPAVTVTGNVTANAGTNLNTSLLALETGGNLATIATRTPALGQALAAASTPVVLTAIQVTALTPPTNTGYALDASLTTIDTDIKSNITLHSGTNVIGHVIADAGSVVSNTPVAAPSIFNGKTTVATAGSRGTLATSQAVQSVTIKALSTNTGFVYVGNTAVASTNGLQLQAGESVSMDVANLNTVNLDVSVNGEGVTYLAVG